MDCSFINLDDCDFDSWNSYSCDQVIGMIKTKYIYVPKESSHGTRILVAGKWVHRTIYLSIDYDH